MGRPGRNLESNAKRQKDGQHVARLEGGHHHQARAHERQVCIETLRNS